MSLKASQIFLNAFYLLLESLLSLKQKQYNIISHHVAALTWKACL